MAGVYFVVCYAVYQTDWKEIYFICACPEGEVRNIEADETVQALQEAKANPHLEPIEITQLKAQMTQ